MPESSFKSFEQLVVEAGLISPGALNRLQEERDKTGKRLLALIIEAGLAAEDELQSLLAEKYGIKKVALHNFKPAAELVKLIPPELCRRRAMLPLFIKNEQLFLAMADPLDLAALDEAARHTGFAVEPVLAKEQQISYLIAQVFSSPAGALQKKAAATAPAAAEPKAAFLTAEEAPVIKLVDALIERAAAEEASDIHLEPAGQNLRIRFRTDGVLHDLPSSFRGSAAQVVSRVKILANLDIAEKRLPQDGNINWRRGQKSVSLRVSTLPTVRGEKVVIRLLEKEKIVLPLKDLGFLGAGYQQFLSLLLNRHGLLLVTGPTGSGKTTTLYSALNYLNRPGVNLVTVEDPVEYHLEGINQVQVLPRIQRNFANSLRSILRQDPDIIMVGEIRDFETARIAVQAALTGHLVLSTLHTNSAAAAVTRLVDMGLEEYLVAASLIGVVAQRLVRTICPNCRTRYRPDPREAELCAKYFKTAGPEELFKGEGCRHCKNTGYKGRAAIKEVLILNRALQDLVLKGAPAEDLERAAIKEGMQTMVQDGLHLVKEGLSTPGEIIRHTFSSLFSGPAPAFAQNSAFFRALHGEK